MVPEGLVSAITGGCPFLIHNDKGGSTLDYVIIGSTDNTDRLVQRPGFVQLGAVCIVQFRDHVASA